MFCLRSIADLLPVVPDSLDLFMILRIDPAEPERSIPLLSQDHQQENQDRNLDVQSQEWRVKQESNYPPGMDSAPCLMMSDFLDVVVKVVGCFLSSTLR